MKPLKLFTSLFALLLGSTIIGAPVAEFLHISHGLASAGVGTFSVTMSLLGVMPTGVLSASTLTITDVLSSYGSYFQNRGQAESSILQQMKEKRQLDAIAQKRVIDGDILELSQAEITGVIQTFKKTFSPKETATFTANPIRTRNIKIDLELYPDDIKSSWLGFLSNIAEGDRMNWPFVRWYFEKLVGPQWGKDLSACDWAGRYIAATNDSVGGPSNGSYDGLKHQVIADQAGSAKMNDLNLSQNLATATDVFNGIEAAASGIPQHWINEEVVFLMSAKTELNYFRDRRNEHGSDYGQNNTQSTGMTVDGRPNWKIVPLLGMDQNDDHDWLVVTPASNILNVTRGTGYNFHMESAKRAVAVMADWHEAMGFGIKELVYFHANALSS